MASFIHPAVRPSIYPVAHLFSPKMKPVLLPLLVLKFILQGSRRHWKRCLSDMTQVFHIEDWILIVHDTHMKRPNLRIKNVEEVKTNLNLVLNLNSFELSLSHSRAWPAAVFCVSHWKRNHHNHKNVPRFLHTQHVRGHSGSELKNRWTSTLSFIFPFIT